MRIREEYEKAMSLKRRPGRRVLAAAASAVLAVSAMMQVPAAHAVIPPKPQGYPIAHLYESCTDASAHAQGYPEWHYGETGRRYLSDGTIQFTNRTDQVVPYTGTIETESNHDISATSAAKLPSGWNTTAKSDIGLKMSNGWVEGETVGPVKLKPGESIRVEYGVLEKDFVSMFVTCRDGVLQNSNGANVIRGTGPAGRYAFVYLIHADGSISDLAMQIPSRHAGANSKPMGSDAYTAMSGPSLESVATPTDHVVEPAVAPQKDPSWPAKGQTCRARDIAWYPYDISSIQPTYRKPGYSTDFLNWSKAPYDYHPVTDFVVGAQYNGYANWMGRYGHPPAGWLGSVDSTYRAYMPVGTALGAVHLQPGERVRVTYGTTMTRVNYREIHCGRDGKYSLVSNYGTASAPSGFWAEATVTSRDGSVRKIDVTPDKYRQLPLPTQSDR